MTMDHRKYKPFEMFEYPERTWPSKRVKEAPAWCSVDLRDGNQALPTPMNIEKKVKTFEMLKKIGFKEIEVAFPSASQTDYDFVRNLIENKMIDDDMAIQVLTQAREHLIEKTFQSLEGCKKSIVHFYNSTSELQRRVVFGKSKKEIIDIAVNGARIIKEYSKYAKGQIQYEYSPESFTGTEMDFALKICEEVMAVLEPTPEKKIIINLPSTVEMHMPNVYADQIEWFSCNIKNRDSVILSVHAHNDRGTAVAASELAMLAGADRVEGTLFGNGERTGNADLITLALNLYTQGIDPKLNFEYMNEIVKIYEECTGMKVPERQPYAGNLVFTAFSGSHQDAITKGLEKQELDIKCLKPFEMQKSQYWNVPYLPIDPKDVGRDYDRLIGINSQSGKGGVAFILENQYGYKLPKEMQPEFGKIIKNKSDKLGEELKPDQIHSTFKKTYLNSKASISFDESNVYNCDNGNIVVDADIKVEKETMNLKGEGDGPISAFVDGAKKAGMGEFTVKTYPQHTVEKDGDKKQVAYVKVNDKKNDYFGVGVDSDETKASFKAIISAINRQYEFEKGKKEKERNEIDFSR